MGLWTITIDEHSEDEDKAVGDNAQDREGEESRDGPCEAQRPSDADERPGDLIGVHKGDLTTRAGASVGGRLRTASGLAGSGCPRARRCGGGLRSALPSRPPQ